MLSASLNKTFLSLSRLYIVPYVGRHHHHMFPQDKARAHTARANRNLLQQHNIRIMPWPALSPDWNPNRTLVGRSATKADNCSRSELCTFSQNMGHDSYDLLSIALFTPCTGGACPCSTLMGYTRGIDS